jgi:hypothetical protein
MSATAQYNLPDFVVGNTWPGVPLYRVNKTYNINDLARVEIDFRTNSPSNPATIHQIVGEYAVASNEIYIFPPDGTYWQFTLLPHVLSLPAGTFYQSIKLIDHLGNPFTFTSGTITGELPSTR